MRHFCTLHDWNAELEPCRHCAADAREREDQLRRAIVASVTGDVSDIDDLFTPATVGQGPATTARSRAELAVEIAERRHALSQEAVTFGPAESRGAMVRLEWEASGLHTGPLVLEGNGAVLEPTGLRLRVRAVTVARFQGRRIASWRSNWEDIALAT